MEEYITRPEYDERQKRLDDENRRQNHRLDKLEQISDQIADIAASVKVMAVTMQGMQTEQKEQGERLKKIEQEPADNWNKLIATAIAVLVTAAITWFISKGGAV